MSEQIPVADDDLHGEVSLTNWEFLGTVPTVEQVRSMLEGLPDVWGVRYADFVDYVQALPQKKKVKKPHPDRPGVFVDEYVEAYTLYMGVAGRIKMMERAATLHGWRVDFVPEPVTPTGLPGYLNHAARLVFRVYVVIQAPIGPWAVADGEVPDVERHGPIIEARKMRSLGRKFGTAWVPAEGGSNAAGTNPYEKVETSALGRALAAWGFGVMPGSGIASVEEMDAIKGNRAFAEAQAGAGATGRARRGAGGNGGERKERGEMIQEALALAEAVRQERGLEEDEMSARIGAFLGVRLGIVGAWNPETGVIDWTKVKDGQVMLLANSFRDTLRNLRDEQSPV